MTFPQIVRQLDRIIQYDKWHVGQDNSAGLVQKDAQN